MPLFQAVVEEWAKVRLSGKSPGYIRTVNVRVRKHILPGLGALRINAITSGDVLRLCRRIELGGYIETAHRVKSLIGQVFRYAIAAGYIENDPTAALSGALKPYNVRHFPTITDPSVIGELYNAIRKYPWLVVRSALLFSILTFARPGEIRQAEWQEMKGDTWDIPASKMKMGRRHLVPLSRQAQAVLEELRECTGARRWVFPAARDNDKCLGPDTVRWALRSLGFTRDVITPHGFRAMASTILNENGWNRDVIERQLAHVEGNAVRRAYNHAEYLDERRRLMQWWGDWLDGLCC